MNASATRCWRNQEKGMKALTLTALIALTALPAIANDETVRGYIRRDGTYVAPHHRSSADSNPYNNYSSRGNSNPYTGEIGRTDPQPRSSYTPQPAPRYEPPQQPRGFTIDNNQNDRQRHQRNW